jgi:putative transferase (TIGR04331 family)
MDKGSNPAISNTQRESRYLVTSADERTWKYDRPILFLGEWCRLPERKHIWKEMDAIVAEPYGMCKVDKDRDELEALAIEERLLELLSEFLNQNQKKEYSKRFWKILLGHWLRGYVRMMLNRIKTLQQCLQSFEISGTTIYASGNYSLACLDTLSSIWASNDDRWNLELNARILNTLTKKNIPLEVLDDNLSRHFIFEEIVGPSNLKSRIISSMRQKIAKFLNFFSRNSDAYIISTYLPKLQELKLQLSLKQTPQLWAHTMPALSDSITTDIFDKSLRESLKNKIDHEQLDQLSSISADLLFECLPICYLEGFNAINNLTSKLPWPKKPKFIYTCNQFATNEIFKCWTANQIDLGTKYFVGQHGGTYGTDCYKQPSIEEHTSDKFLTWGWTGPLHQHTPAFIFKAVNKNVEMKKKQSIKSTGGLLLTQDMYYHRIDTWDRSADYKEYFNDHVQFVKKLTLSQREHLTIRLHPTYRYRSPYEEERWHDVDPSLVIDKGSTDIKKLIAQSRLVVHGYDSTGILEALALNIPCIAFWRDGFDHLNDFAKPYYQILVEAGIVHLSPESAAQHVDKVWSDVEEWWWQKDVQDARSKFTSFFAKPSKNPVKELKKIFHTSIRH